jgi:WD40 repeat protein
MNANQSEPGVLRLHGIALATAMTFLCCAPAAAQIVNPIQAARDAVNKAKQQKAAPATVNGKASNGAAPANGSSTANPNGPFTPPPGTKIEPTLLAPRVQGAQFAVSPRGVHMGTVSHSGSRWTVIYDGVPGPQFDQIFPQGNSLTGLIFSPDGSRYAYCGLQGNEAVVMVDGKELFRDSRTNVQNRIDANSCQQLSFTSNNKHVYFFSMSKYEGATDGFRFVFDGKADALGSNADLRNFAFSPDGDHVAYVWSGCGRDTTQKLLIDGKPAPYLAGNPQWSADSQHLYTTATRPQQQIVEVLVDGKPMIRANSVRLFIPPVGNMVVALATKNNGAAATSSVVIGGKVVPGSEVTAGISNCGGLTFSADGKHYALVCTTANGRAYVFADGKKGLDYGRLDPFYSYGTKGAQKTVRFTESGSPVFVGNSGGAQFVVVGNQESNQMNQLGEVAISPVGNHVVAAALHSMAVDGKVIPMPQSERTFSLVFSPDGSHIAYGAQERNGIVVYLDGTPQREFVGFEVNQSDGHFLTQSLVHFSPDSKHLAYFCRSADPAAGNNQGVCLDGKYLPVAYTGTLGNLTFSQDSNHLFWNVWSAVKFRTYVDGKPVVEIGAPSTGGLDKVAFQEDGSNGLLILGQDEAGFKRIRVTPAADSSLATMFGSSVVASR